MTQELRVINERLDAQAAAQANTEREIASVKETLAALVARTDAMAGNLTETNGRLGAMVSNLAGTRYERRVARIIRGRLSGVAGLYQSRVLHSERRIGGVSEEELKSCCSVIRKRYRSLPIAAIDAFYAGAVPICRQLSLPAGFANALFVNYLGRLTLTEFELWRNPQARREVIGQILDYAKDLASWDYADLQRQVSLALGKSGNALYHLVCQRVSALSRLERSAVR